MKFVRQRAGSIHAVGTLRHGGPALTRRASHRDEGSRRRRPRRNTPRDGPTARRPDGLTLLRHRRPRSVRPSPIGSESRSTLSAVTRIGRWAPPPRRSPRVRARPPVRPSVAVRSERHGSPLADCDRSRALAGSSNTIAARQCRDELPRPGAPHRRPCFRRPNVPELRQSVSTDRPAVRPSGRQTVA